MHALAVVFLLTAQPAKVIIDADPGIDDSMAILFALHAESLDVLGITTVFGNATIEAGTTNALRLVELSGKNVPVYRGAAEPLEVPVRPPPDFVHGANGLGNVDAPEPSRRAEPVSAEDFIIETVKRYPNEVTLIAVGRMTNLARALEKDPSITSLVREVVIMGGAASVPGNVSPVTEANIGGDPHAADEVFTAGWPLTMVGLDCTTRVRLTDERLRRIADESETIGGFIWDISRFYRDFYDSIGVIGGFYVHDPSAIGYVLDRGLFDTREAPVRVVTEGIAIGQTIAADAARASEWEPWRDRPVTHVCADVDSERLLDLFEDTLTSSDGDRIRSIRRASNDAIAARDLDTMRRTWFDDMNVVASSGDVIDGGEEMVRRFEAAFEDPEFITYVRTPTSVHVSDGRGFASERGEWVGTWQKPDGEMNVRGEYLAQWQRREGEWRLRAEVFVALSCAGSASCEERR